MGNVLSTEQVLLLENLMYLTNADPLKSITEMGSGKTVADLVNVDINSLADNQDYGSYMTGEDWKNLIQAVQNDDTLMNMQIVATHIDNAEGGGGGVSALLANPETGEAVVAFRGTAGNEWKDNFVGGGVTNTVDGVSTQQQFNALEWYQSLDLDDYSTITVTGHSKGGNKAKYIAIMDGSVDRCIAFDGQGFSDEFMDKYSELIASRQDKINNHNAEYDYVNLLLNDVGNTTYYQGNDLGEGGFLENHCPNTMFKFNDDGTFQMIPVKKRAEEMAELDEFLNSYLRSLSGDDKQKALEIVGNIAEMGFNNATVDDILDMLLEGDGVGQMAYLLAYFMRYEQENPQFADAIRNIMNKFGMDSFIETVDMVDSILNWKYFDKVMDILSLADKLPNWILDDLAQLIYDKFGITLSVEELRKLLSVIGTANEDMDVIEVIADGRDRVIKYDDFHSFSLRMGGINNSGESMRYFSKQLADFYDELVNISVNLDGTKGMLLARLRLKNITNKLIRESKAMMIMGNGIEQVLEMYSDTEDNIVEHTINNL